ncbi:type IV inositol polyphosphate 5-phosphatase 6-like isoform X1 [Salvia miltiorrhiza]|uniref:type IV inositol polyphosphate 5-phosphatase 6-like isoform X1 n=1 Tax=Salvia miltiorrhiza TaxID=226208 RepID=UPI0025ACAC5A|nr:type IV inositol polyphosphate 5-phosphatase 6-like isoform X1 [Salvia miltiorrhiza]XP_057783408.1 type IV inositol polyphosphate 5-phosphatase 6-like isoform X1 [Salvia miltiorrhiza]XP_057783409.1 type IV inositol polyphosphate 5-phosphatase 6-like isoform X1 [Salvia miltiorrhiza]XP_057783410.1 type IV inositol polyphosphate 5-phosphatase 6-like isoform X1 [Salvia miltiorrhiza]
MKDENCRQSKLSWSKKLVRKWFNIKCKGEEFQADEEAVYGGGEMEWRSCFSEREPSTIKKSKTEDSAKNMERSFSRTRSRSRRGRGYLDHPQILNIQNYSVFVSTWNVGGKPPRSNMNLDDWLHSAPSADVYVLGFQEIVPLNAGNILGAEDNGPAKKWLTLIKRTLDNAPGTSGVGGCYTSSPMPDPVAEWNADFEGSSRNKASTFLPRRSFQTPPQRWNMDNDMSIPQPPLDRRLSVCDRVIFGHRQSDFGANVRWGCRPSDCSSSQRTSDFSCGPRPSDYSSGPRPSDYSSSRRPSDFEEYLTGESPSTVLQSRGCAPAEDAYTEPGRSRYSLVASKQMVGIFLTVWVRSEMKEHVRNIKISCVGRGLMGYLGNKGSISISMMLHQTSLCFVCSHLTSGEKEGDELRRNADVMEILRKTRFPRINSINDEKSPETILEHDRIIWLGDLNYRIALPYRSAKALVEMQNWRALLEKDQLRIEQRRGRVFDGWKEGKIYFPPTYKYSHNSDRYAGDDMHPKEKRRTPAWCDRILWYGGGLQQLSYARGESRFSDHRPVSSVFWAEVELVPNRFRKSTSCSSSRIEVEELLPYTHSYTELCFF